MENCLLLFFPTPTFIRYNIDSLSFWGIENKVKEHVERLELLSLSLLDHDIPFN